MNATQAAIRAGYSKRTAGSQGQRLLKNVEIKKKLQEIGANASRENQIEIENVVREIGHIAFSDIRDFVRVERKKIEGPGGEIEVTELVIIPTDDMTPQQSRAIKSIKSTRHGLSIELHDKLEALEKLMKYTGAYEKDNEQTRPVIESVTFRVIGEHDSDET